MTTTSIDPKQLISILEKLDDKCLILIGDSDTTPTFVNKIYFDPNNNFLTLLTSISEDYESDDQLIWGVK